MKTRVEDLVVKHEKWNKYRGEKAKPEYYTVPFRFIESKSDDVKNLFGILDNKLHKQSVENICPVLRLEC